MNPDIQQTIQFKQSPGQFVISWRFNEVMRATGRLVSYLIIGLSILLLIGHVVFEMNAGRIPVITLLNGEPLSRLVWFSIILDLGAAYILAEVRRRQDYASTDDVFNFMDHNSRLFFVSALTKSWESKQQLGIDFTLLCMLQENYFLNLLDKLETGQDKLDQAMANFQPCSATPLSGVSFEIDTQMQELMTYSAGRALARGDSCFGLADIFLSMLEKDEQIKHLFEVIDITDERFKVVIEWFSTTDHIRKEYQDLHNQYMHTGPQNKAWTTIPTPTLNQYGQDMTIAVSRGAVPMVTVREKQIQTIVEVLSRSTKSSIILAGEPGVGKSSIVERVALRMLTDDVPEVLKDKRLVKVDVAALHGDKEGFSVAFEQVMNEAERAGNVIVFIPDLQDLATEKSSGLPVVEMLLPILERANMQIIGATTIKQYHEQIEQNSSITDAFEVIEIPEVSEKEAISILEESSLTLAYQHHVQISLKAIEAAVKLSSKYIHDHVLPEKAIDILDEASVMVAEAKRNMVVESDIQAIISRKTNVPVENVGQTEQSVLLNLEERLHARVIGQEEAVVAVSEALRRARAGLSDSNRPIGTFLFVGPTGVGKTELAKALAEAYFHNEETMVRLDMSEYQDESAVSKLIGEAGRDGALTAPVRTHPFTLLLLDEFEKASSSIRNLFLQVFDDGRLTDGQGHVVDFKNCIIIATSNAGSLEIQQAVGAGQRYEQMQQMLIQNILPKIYTPELLNRFDGVIVFKPLSEVNILTIAKLQIDKLVVQTKAASGINLSVTEAAIAELARTGFDPLYGGRPLRRTIQDRLESPLAKKMLGGGLTRGDNLIIDVGDLAVGATK